MERMIDLLIIDFCEWIKENFSKRKQEEKENQPTSVMINSRAVEIDFCEWIEKENIGSDIIEKIYLMPMVVFERFADRFCQETGKGEDTKSKLKRYFKGSRSNTFWNKLKKILPSSEKYERKPFEYIYQRYLYNTARYKCIILPIRSDYKNFQKLVVRKWMELNRISDNYLDIYYCFLNYGKTGHDLMEELHCLSKKFWAKLPCIIIWKENMKEAMCISINELTAEDVFYMIVGNNGIIDSIIEGKTLNEIVEGVSVMGEKRRNKERATYEYVQKAEGSNNQQNMIIGSTGVNILNGVCSENSNAFFKEIEEAIRLISSSELNQVQKEELKSILEEARDSVKENSKDKKTSSKSRFSTFCKLADEKILPIIAALADFITIASFFGLKMMGA